MTACTPDDAQDVARAAIQRLDDATLDMLERRAREVMIHGKGGSVLALIADLRAARSEIADLKTDRDVWRWAAMEWQERAAQNTHEATP